MAKFKSIKDALEQGYKIFSIDYHLVYQEFSVFLWNKDDKNKGVHFYCKKLPAYLEPNDFDKVCLENENWAYFKMELVIAKYKE